MNKKPTKYKITLKKSRKTKTLTLKNAGDILGLIHDGKSLFLLDLIYGTPPKEIRSITFYE